MAVRFILGRSGTGKTSYCIESIVNALLDPHDTRPLILLVPEQATYQAERSILAEPRISGYNRLHVLSFDRLQFMLLGRNTARPAISRIGRQMIVQRILRDNHDSLKVFGPSAAWPGLGRRIAQTVCELHGYAKTPEDVDALVGRLEKDENSRLAVLKFADIGLVLTEYIKFIDGRFDDPDMQLAQARSAVADAPLVKDARLWVDGFAGFTQAELAVLVELLRAARDSHIALCLDPADTDLDNPDAQGIDQVGLFGPTQRTYADLWRLIKQAKQALAEPVILERAVRFADCPQLAHAERHIFNPEQPRAESAGRIRIVSAPNERAEVRFAAGQILGLVKQGGCRYRDIAVIASDIDRYEHYIRAYFADYGLPFFIDKRRPLNRHPVVHLICSGLQAAAGGFAASDIFAYLKTDLAPVDRSDVDLLENYCIAFGVQPRDWQDKSPWSFAGPDEEDFDETLINRIRRDAAAPLLALRDRLCPPDDRTKTMGPAEFTCAVFDFLDDLGVKRTIARWIEQALARNDKTAVDEHRQFYSRLVELFDELVDIFEGRSMTAEDYLAIIASAFSQLTLAFIPPTLDQVLVGSIERSRHPDLRAVFLLGATQRQFPAPVVTDSILTDSDRRLAESADFALAPSSTQKLAERRYLAYIAFTRPSEFLCLTYPCVDEKGAALARSQFVDELQSLFDDVEEESIAGRQHDIDEVHTTGELADLLCTHLSRDVPSSGPSDERSGELLEHLLGDDVFADVAATVVSALSYDNRAELQPEVTEKLYGSSIRTSITRLGTFAACPYQHFARYVLRLQERRQFKFEPLDLGAFYHRVLDALFKTLGQEKTDFGQVEDTRLTELLRAEVARLTAGDPFISNFARHSRHNTFIIASAAEVLEDCVRAIAQMVRAGDFRPVLSEASFGPGADEAASLGACEFAVSGGDRLSLAGKIDRIDFAKSGGKEAAIIFDYKRSEHAARFNWSHFYHGLDMQLPAYMLAVRKACGSKFGNVVGAFYMPIEVTPSGSAIDELETKAESFRYKARGVFNGDFHRLLDNDDTNTFYNFHVTTKGDQYGYEKTTGALRPADFESLLRYTEHKTVRLAEEILSGRIEAKPYRLRGYSPCGYCKYKSVCRFDWQISDYNALASMAKPQVLQKIGTIDG